MKPERITLVQLARFGDLLQSSPLIQRIRQQATGEITVRMVVEARTVPAAKLLFGVDEVVGIDLNGAAKLAAGGYPKAYTRLQSWASSSLPRDTSNRLILLNQGSLPSAIASLLPAETRLGPMRGTAEDRPHRLLTQLLSNRRLNPLHLSEIWGSYERGTGPLSKPKLAMKTTGTTLAKYTGGKALTDGNSKRYALNLGAGSAGRRLSGAKLAELAASLLKDRKNGLFLLGTEADRQTANELIRALPESVRNRAFNTAGETSLSDLADLLSAMELLISSDTGTLQLSAATGTPSLGLFFGGANPVETGPWCDQAVSLVRKDTLDEGNEPSAEDLRWAVEIAEAITNGGLKEEWDDESSTCALLVARPAPVGLRHTPLRRGDCPVGRGWRWRGFFAFLLGIDGEDARPTKSAAETAGEDGLERAERLLTLLDTLHRRGGAADPAWDEEDLWLARIAGAFPVQTERWAMQEKEKHEAFGRIEA